VLVQTHGVGRLRAAVLALVADGARRAPAAPAPPPRRPGWRVTDVGG
jgi:hypothetical protein